MVLLIDNYDSFVFNLARYIAELGVETRVVRNDAIDVAGVRALGPRAIVLSPGPCAPADSGICRDLVRELASTIPLLGVCLGHQAIADAMQGRVSVSGQPFHGRASLVTHDGSGLFGGIPSPFRAGRYHSLVVERQDLPEDFRVTAQTLDGTVMALEHRTWPLWGVQFHPESVLTEYGHRLLANFLGMAGIATGPIPAGDLPPAAGAPDFYALPIADDAGPVI